MRVRWSVAACSVAVLMATIGPARAQSTVALDEFRASPTGTNEAGEMTYTLRGRCGPATVSVEGATHDDTPGYRVAFSAKVKVVAPKGEADSANALEFDSDNEIACVQGAKGPLLLLAAWCNATACPPVQYQVIDTTSAALLTKGDWDHPCDRRCAEKSLGTTVPVDLQTF